MKVQLCVAMPKHWFKPKHYGYGFYPISWEGWLATLFLLALVLTSAFINGIFEESGASLNGALRFVLDVFLLGGVATFFFDKKTKEELKWRWGRR